MYTSSHVCYTPPQSLTSIVEAFCHQRGDFQSTLFDNHLHPSALASGDFVANAIIVSSPCACITFPWLQAGYSELRQPTWARQFPCEYHWLSDKLSKNPGLLNSGLQRTTICQVCSARLWSASESWIRIPHHLTALYVYAMYSRWQWVVVISGFCRVCSSNGLFLSFQASVSCCSWIICLL